MNEKSKSIFSKVPKVLYENRYCNQEGFSVLICGGYDKNKKITNEVLELEIPSFRVNRFPSMVKPHSYFFAATIKSDVVAIGENQETDMFLDKSLLFIEIYSEKTKTWNHQYIQIDDRICFGVRSFLSKLYLIGGYNNSSCKTVSSCYIYDIKSKIWNEIARLNVARECAACTVFEGNIVVTGGDNDMSDLKSVEAYDYHENKWTYLPDMNEKRINHAAVSMGNKLFVIGGDIRYNCEVLDSFSRKFTIINSEIKEFDFEMNFNAFSIRNNILVFQVTFTETVVYLYDVDKENW